MRVCVTAVAYVRASRGRAVGVRARLRLLLLWRRRRSNAATPVTRAPPSRAPVSDVVRRRPSSNATPSPTSRTRAPTRSRPPASSPPPPNTVRPSFPRARPTLAHVQIPPDGPDQTMSEIRVSDKTVDFVLSCQV